MKYFLIVLTFLFNAASLRAQTAEDSVKAAINKMFAAMKNTDSEQLQSVFSDNMVLQTISKNKSGALTVLDEKPAEFIKQIGASAPGDLDEQIQFYTVLIDGPLAFAWTPYSFFYKGKFSHCGVNSFQLVRFAEGWKIQYIIDTRRRKGCENDGLKTPSENK